jgi:hypothetical protein
MGLMKGTPRQSASYGVGELKKEALPKTKTGRRETHVDGAPIPMSTHDFATA